MPLVFKGVDAFAYCNFIVQPEPNVPENAIVLPSGRKLYRHSTLPGSVLVFNDGRWRQVLIVDSTYRSLDAPYGGKWENVGITPVQLKENSFNLPNSDNESWTDEYINSIVVDFQTSKELTDKLLTSTTADTAAKICRNIALPNNLTCDLPNINTLIRICLASSYIDNLDPTISVSRAWGDDTESKKMVDIWNRTTNIKSIGALSSSQTAAGSSVVIVKYNNVFTCGGSDYNYLGNTIPIVEL
nr:MAG TPA: hypothetical protein [Caudoviricetes sp.]